jgi:hypothetical protein
MKKLLLAGAFALGLATTPVSADTLIDDPLHGLVCTSAANCTNAGDNGTFTPLGSVTNFGFSISPGPKTGDFTLVVGVPSDEINVGTFNLPGLLDNGGGILTTAFNRVSLFNAGLLSSYLGLGSFSPTDSFTNLSAGTSTFDPTFGGNFLLFTVTLTGVTVGDNSGCGVVCSTTHDFSFGDNLPGGSFITGLFVTTDNQGNPSNVGTAASAHLVTTFQVPGPIVGAGLPGLFGLMMLGLARMRQTRQWWKRLAQA